ncbi:sensor histidine kinase [Candidatus Aalborgicola defluviihabitans]|jgi:two-component system sensor histidine kinase DctS|uniref:sensor histidine kinase n=1 Tax=Candidatus Aalborgicola defluviihabitans TaxID=3386187 RepID=UPI001D6D7DB4|nr:PAS domain S-box protein [Burkholderiales bacterium]MBK6570342.1 PAS domain S-box protein [Burkholderiales bacterium]MBK7279345.1 PAS domain S-box protein [Burkholderiales bacterium]MBL0243770.1 PAS domain S-box protein [Rhodoferax sp.]
MATAPIAPHSDGPQSGRSAFWGRWLWVAPLLLSVAFTALVVLWAQDNDKLEREVARRSMVADTLSLDAQLTGRMETEATRLRSAAVHLPPAGPDADRQLANLPEIAAGLDRRWLSVLWLDVNNRIVGEARRDQRPGGLRLASGEGITLHLVAPTSDARRPQTGQLIARYDPADLIKSKDFWWLAAQYEVQLLGSQDQVIVSTESAGRPALGESYEMAFIAIPDTRLRLTLRARQPPWFTTLPVVLMVGFLALITAATLLLRRQINQVARAESAWRTEAAWRQSLEESALVGLRARDLDGHLLFANRTFCDMVGYSLEELIAQGPASNTPVPNQSGIAVQRAKREGFETRWRHRDGHFFDVMVFESPLVDGLGQQVGWMASIVDVTERKRLEELERRQREVLANHARLSTLGEVASTLAHELNQPLTSIVSYSAGIARALQRRPDADPDLVAAAQALSRHATQAGGIVHRIRARLARRELVLEACDINPLVAAAVTLLQREIRRAGVEVTLELTPGLPAVRVDRIGIEQVISNLLRNACDVMTGPNPGKKLLVRTGLCVEPPLDSVLGWIAVDISDQGPGLGGRDMETLTEPFFSTKQEGTGLGLAICRSILESHGGVLHAQDVPGGGARFSFFLPTERPTPEARMP